MSLSYKNLELECHCLRKMWSWKVIVLEKFGAGMSLSYCATERKKEKNNNNTCNNNNNNRKRSKNNKSPNAVWET